MNNLGIILKRELTGRYKIRVNGYRLIYKVNEEDKFILILAIRVRGRDTYITGVWRKYSQTCAVCGSW